MSGLRGPRFASHTTLVIFSLIVVGTICALLTFTHVLAATIVSDNFNDNSLDTSKWGTTLFSGFTNTSLGLNETSQRLEIGIGVSETVAGQTERHKVDKGALATTGLAQQGQTRCPDFVLLSLWQPTHIIGID